MREGGRRFLVSRSLFPRRCITPASRSNQPDVVLGSHLSPRIAWLRVPLYNPIRMNRAKCRLRGSFRVVQSIRAASDLVSHRSFGSGARGMVIAGTLGNGPCSRW